MELLDLGHLTWTEVVILSMIFVAPAALIFYFAFYKKEDREDMSWDEKKENFLTIAFVCAIPIIIILCIVQCS